MNFGWSPYGYIPPPTAILNFDPKGAQQQSPVYPIHTTANESLDTSVASLLSRGEAQNTYALRQPFYGHPFGEWPYPYVNQPLPYPFLHQNYAGSQEPLNSSKETSDSTPKNAAPNVTPDRTRCGAIGPNSEVEVRDPSPFYAAGSPYAVGGCQYYLLNRYPQSAPPKVTWSHTSHCTNPRCIVSPWHQPPPRYCSTCIQKSHCAPQAEENTNQGKKRNQKTRRKLGFESATQDEAKNCGKGTSSCNTQLHTANDNVQSADETSEHSKDCRKNQDGSRVSDCAGVGVTCSSEAQAIETRKDARVPATDPSSMPYDSTALSMQQQDPVTIHDIDELYQMFFPDAYSQNLEVQGTADDPSQYGLTENIQEPLETNFPNDSKKYENTSSQDFTIYTSLISGNLDESTSSQLDYHFVTEENSGIPRVSITHKEEETNKKKKKKDKRQEKQKNGADTYMSEMEKAVNTILTPYTDQKVPEEGVKPFSYTIEEDFLPVQEVCLQNPILPGSETPAGNECNSFFDFPFNFEELLQEVEISSSDTGYVDPLLQQNAESVFVDSISVMKPVVQELQQVTNESGAEKPATVVEPTDKLSTEESGTFYDIQHTDVRCAQSQEADQTVLESSDCLVPPATIEVEITTTADDTDNTDQCPKDSNSLLCSESEGTPFYGDLETDVDTEDNAHPIIFLNGFTEDSQHFGTPNDNVKDAITSVEPVKSVKDAAIQVSICDCCLKHRPRSLKPRKSPQKHRLPSLNGFTSEATKSVELILDEDDGKKWYLKKDMNLIRRIMQLSRRQNNANPNLIIQNRMNARSMQTRDNQSNDQQNMDKPFSGKVKLKRLQNGKCFSSSSKTDGKNVIHVLQTNETKKKTSSAKTARKTDKVKSKKEKTKTVKTDKKPLSRSPCNFQVVDLTLENTVRANKQSLDVDNQESSNTVTKKDPKKSDEGAGEGQGPLMKNGNEAVPIGKVLQTESGEDTTARGRDESNDDKHENNGEKGITENGFEVTDSIAEELEKTEAADEARNVRSTRYNLRRLAHKPSYDVL